MKNLKFITIIFCFLLWSCSGQSPKPVTNTVIMDKSLPEQMDKPVVASADKLEWESLLPVKFHRASSYRDYTKPEYKEKRHDDLMKTFNRFSIINNGTIHTSAHKLHFFSRDHGKNWYEFEPFFEDGKKFPDSIGMNEIYHTPDFFVMRTSIYSKTPQTVAGNKKGPTFYISYNGSIWKEASKSNFVFDDYVPRRMTNLLYKKANPETFERLKKTRPNDYHSILFNMKDMSATIYPYKDESYTLPKKLQYGSKDIFKSCDGNFIYPRSNFPYIEKGKSLANLESFDYDVTDSIILADSKSRINNARYQELGCHLLTQLTIKDERGYRAGLLAILSNNPDTPGKIEIVNTNPTTISSSQNGKYMIVLNHFLSRNKNMLDCACEN